MAKKKDDDDGLPPIINVTSHDQQGGVTAGIYNAVPEPELSDRQMVSREWSNGQCMTVEQWTLKSSQMINGLRVEAHGDTVQGVMFGSSGMTITGDGGQAEWGAWNTLLQPSGNKVGIIVVTSDADPDYEIKYAID